MEKKRSIREWNYQYSNVLICLYKNKEDPSVIIKYDKMSTFKAGRPGT